MIRIILCSLLAVFLAVPVVISSGSADDLPESSKWFADALAWKSDGPEALLAAIDKAMRFKNRSQVIAWPSD